MKQHLIALFACTALFAAACSESKPPLATAKPAPAAPAPVEPKVAIAVEPPAPEKDSAVGSGEEVRTDAQQVAAFEQKVLK